MNKQEKIQYLKDNSKPVDWSSLLDKAKSAIDRLTFGDSINVKAGQHLQVIYLDGFAIGEIWHKESSILKPIETKYITCTFDEQLAEKFGGIDSEICVGDKYGYDLHFDSIVEFTRVVVQYWDRIYKYQVQV